MLLLINVVLVYHLLLSKEITLAQVFDEIGILENCIKLPIDVWHSIIILSNFLWLCVNHCGLAYYFLVAISGMVVEIST